MIRSLVRSLDPYSFATGALVAVTVAAFALWFFAPAEAARPAVRYIECADGGVHAWVTPEGGIAVLPAGTECAE